MKAKPLRLVLSANGTIARYRFRLLILRYRWRAREESKEADHANDESLLDDCKRRPCDASSMRTFISTNDSQERCECGRRGAVRHDSCLCGSGRFRSFG